MFASSGLAKNELESLGKRVLLVDDEEAVLKAVSRMLCKRVIVDTATSVKEAMFKVFLNDYSAVISDFEMPGRDGVWFLGELTKLAPMTRRILHSGSDPSDIEEHLRSGVIHEFIRKPATVNDFSVIL